jgi:hypothetical protein
VTRPLAALSAALVLLAAPVAGADPTKIECARANADAQALRMDGKLAAARAQLEMCQGNACPALVRDDCAQRLDDLEHAQPTVVFDVKDPAGADVSAVTVFVDGTVLVRQLGGDALRVDPGEHSFAFAAVDHASTTQHLLIREGEKYRRERILLAPTSSAPAPAPATEKSSSFGTGGSAARTVFALSAGGVGVAAAATGGVFGGLALSASNRQKTACPSDASCTSRSQALADHTSAVSDSTISDVMLAAGVALIAGGALLYITAPRTMALGQPAALQVMPSIGPGGGGMLLRGRF